jgi:anthranilate synthase component 2
MRILLVDFYDSFTFNLAHYLEPLCDCVHVVRDKEVSLDDLNRYDKIILSPGPGLPLETCSMFPILNALSGKKPILGVCLGMQGIAQFLGGDLIQKSVILHGKPVQISVLKNDVLFDHVPTPFQGGLYHSWQVELPKEKQSIITARDEFGVIMAIEAPSQKLYGVQFHPESILTEYGKTILENFMNSN